jgi:cyclopropane-fatty-acyl-phospholipid synthase
MSASAAHKALSWVEQGYVPDRVVRIGIRRLLQQRLAEVCSGDVEARAHMQEAFLQHMQQAPLAFVPEKANEQHYEVPAAFFEKVLGPHRKYSSCYWPEGCTDLKQAEEAALRITCKRAQLAGGQRILELGCGWGSLSLWMASHYPASHITAVSNSQSQREAIEAMARQRGLKNLQVITADFNHFETSEQFDRVVSVEMFEHLRNWPTMFVRVASWLKPGGRFFMHVFCHRSVPYAFVDGGEADWMSRHFFSGGMMPSDELALRFQDDLQLLSRWRWDGRHYEKTANAWLANLDAQREAVLPLLVSTYGARNAAMWLQRWRIFFMACAELFGFRRGQEWWVSHYLFERRAP